MSNFKNDILEAVAGEPIEALVIGSFTGGLWSDEPKGSVPPDKLNQVVSWDEAAQWLDYEYSSDLGLADCHAIYVWTPTRVFHVHEYDGHTELMGVPRSPISVDVVFA